MPILRYVLRVEDDLMTETDTFPPLVDPREYIEKKIVKPLQEARAKLREPTITLEKVEIVSEYVHQHEWNRGFVNKFALKTYYHCLRCGIAGWRYTTLFEGEQGPVNRDEAYKKSKFDLCRDQLKELPKTISFGTTLVNENQ